MNRSFDSKHLVFTTCAGFVDRESRYCSLLLFCVREINRFLEILNRGSRKILRVSRNSNLDPRNSILETRASILDVRFSKTSRIEDRVSSRDCQLTFARYCTCTIAKSIYNLISSLQRFHACERSIESKSNPPGGLSCEILSFEVAGDGLGAC